MEFKLFDEENISLFFNLGNNFDYLKINAKDEEKIEIYDSNLNFIIELIL